MKMLRLSHAECNTWQPVVYWWSLHRDQDLGLLLSLSCVLRSKEMLFWLLSLSFSCSVMSNSFSTPRTTGCQAPLSMGFPRQEYWSGNRNVGEDLNDNNDYHAIINSSPPPQTNTNSLLSFNAQSLCLHDWVIPNKNLTFLLTPTLHLVDRSH